MEQTRNKITSQVSSLVFQHMTLLLSKITLTTKRSQRVQIQSFDNTKLENSSTFTVKGFLKLTLLKKSDLKITLIVLSWNWCLPELHSENSYHYSFSLSLSLVRVKSGRGVP